MKKLIILFFCLISLNALAQFEKVKYDKKVYVYKSYIDFKEDKAEYVGIYDGAISGNTFGLAGALYLYIKKDENTKKKNFKIKKSYWGFRIGEFIFRRNRNDASFPLLVYKHKNKVFYINGEIALSMIKKGSDSGTAWGSRGFFYSDTFESKTFYITRIIGEEKNDSTLIDISKCIKKAKKRFGDQGRFNGYQSCIDDF